MESVAWDSPIVTFLKELERNAIPLVLDIRVNNGGNISFPNRLMEHLARNDGVSNSFGVAYRVTPSMRQLWQRSIGKTETRYLLAQKYVSEAVYKKKRHTRVWKFKDEISYSQEVGGFNQKILTLIGPKCLSACDILAGLLKASNRATLIGQSTNGTGGGFFEWEPYGKSEWTDPFEVVKAQIPNSLFGFPMPKNDLALAKDNAFIKFNSENKPTTPHITYRTKFGDFKKRDKFLFKTAAREILK